MLGSARFYTVPNSVSCDVIGTRKMLRFIVFSVVQYIQIQQKGSVWRGRRHIYIYIYLCDILFHVLVSGGMWGVLLVVLSVPRCGSGPMCLWRALPSIPLRPRTLPPHQLGPPSAAALQKEPRGCGEEGGRGWGGKGCGLREGSSNCKRGMGPPKK